MTADVNNKLAGQTSIICILKLEYIHTYQEDHYIETPWLSRSSVAISDHSSDACLYI